jgi:tetratricopeptide (TPR) repeat protein
MRVEDDTGRPRRVWGAVWVSERFGLIHVAPEEALDTHGPQLAVRALVEFGLRQADKMGGRAARLKVTDRALAELITATLADRHTTVEVVDSVPAVRDVLRQLAEDAGEEVPAALSAPGVTAERLHAFAEAAALFFRAAPWRHLDNDDVVIVEAPTSPPGFSHLVVMGYWGLDFGLTFFPSRAAVERLLDSAGNPPRMPEALWGVSFEELDNVPWADADAFEQLRLPVAGDRAYPVAARYSRRHPPRRPDAAQLAHFECVLRALAATTEDQMDAGRWTVPIDSVDGRVEMTLSLPGVLEADAGTAPRPRRFAPDLRSMERMQARVAHVLAEREYASLDEANAALKEAMRADRLNAPFEEATGRAATPRERAQELVYDALELAGRARVKRVRQAIAIDPDCADAWVLLAEGERDVDRARELYERAVAAAERVLGPGAFEDLAGHFWGHVETRPYMRARLGLANVLDMLGETVAAREHLDALLALNPNDNQGVRDLLLPLLFEQGDDERAAALLAQYKDDATAIWRYGHALSCFRRQGDSEEARGALRAAVEANQAAARWLVDPERVTATSDEGYRLGSDEEAAYVVEQLVDAWDETPGALAWLAAHAKRGPAPGARSARRGGGTATRGRRR